MAIRVSVSGRVSVDLELISKRPFGLQTRLSSCAFAKFPLHTSSSMRGKFGFGSKSKFSLPSAFLKGALDKIILHIGICIDNM
jgi:hypothetical protein